MQTKFSSLLLIALFSLLLGSVVSILFIIAARPPEIISILIIPFFVLITYAIVSFLYAIGIHHNLQHASYRRHDPPHDNLSGVREPRRPYPPILSNSEARSLPIDDEE